MTALRWPAEWEPQAGVLVAWPHDGTDWAPRLPRIEAAYTQLVAAIARFVPVVVIVADARVRERAREALVHIDPSRLRFVLAEYDDTWLRDSGPLAVHEGTRFVLNDFRFTGWGGKFDGGRDDRLIAELEARDVFANATRRRIDWALEGGAVETDGRGTLLTTWQCLHHRHPELDRATMDRQFIDVFGVSRVLWLDHGYLQGDDTDAHIDTLARLAPNDAIVFQACDDASDPHFAELARMRAELESLRTAEGKPYTLHALPWAGVVEDEGRRLASSYANYLIVDGGVVMPSYAAPADAKAAKVIAAAHPGREVVAVDARDLIWQNGSVHCLTMQMPAGSLAPFA